MEANFYLEIAGFILNLLLLTYYIIYMIAEIRILEKEGEKGWKALIPIYNFYVTYRIEGVFVPWFYFAASCTILEFIEDILKICSVHMPVWLEIIFAAANLLMLITESVFSVHLGRSFGKSTAFKAGLVILPQIFYPILAFGKSKFIHRKQGAEDAGLSYSATKH